MHQERARRLTPRPPTTLVAVRECGFLVGLARSLARERRLDLVDAIEKKRQVRPLAGLESLLEQNDLLTRDIAVAPEVRHLRVRSV